MKSQSAPSNSAIKIGPESAENSVGKQSSLVHSKMFKLILLVSAFAAFATSASLKISPDELQLIFQTLEADVQVRVSAAQIEIRNTLVPVKILVQDAKAQLDNEIEDSGSFYYKEIVVLQQEAELQGKDISSCIESANYSVVAINLNLTETYYTYIEDSEREAEDSVQQAVDITANALSTLDELKQRIYACSDNDCAQQLDIELVEFYGAVVKVIYNTIEDVNVATLQVLPDNLSKAVFDKVQYSDQLYELVSEVGRCL
ncbi:hypothetical protein HUJ04_008386 [Dendroctonus ponderosae]|nr:hypothetical protein HUJ04_008386 [Dendroctonus ponderosae]